MILLILFIVSCLIVIGLYFFRIKKFQSAKIFTSNVGKFKVVTLVDGSIDCSLKNIFKNSIDFEHSCFNEKSYDSIVKIPVNSYIVDTGYKIILVDIGLSGLNKTNTGFLNQALDLAGYNPEQITDIFISNLCLENISGLLTEDGKKVFVNANLYISKEDFSYWIYDQQDNPEISSQLLKFIVPYALHTFIQNKKIFDGLSEFSINGHLSGKCGFLFESENKKLFISADILYISELKYLYPELSLKNDIDKLISINARKDLFDYLSKENILLGGTHLPFPGLGYIQKSLTDDKLEYVFIPLSDIKNK